MIVNVTRTDTNRMTDMYVIHFPGHPHRIMPFAKENWEKEFELRLPRGGSRQMELSVEKTDD